MDAKIIGTLPLLSLSTLVITGCITTDVRIVEPQEIQEICIHDNPAVMMDGFLPNLQEEVQKKGIATRVYTGPAAPTDCPYTMEYTANWNWDIAVYLEYAKIELYKEGRQIGRVEYDGRMAGLSLTKFKTAEAKVDPLIAELLQNVR